MAKGVEGETVERNEEDGVYRAIVARLIQFFLFTAEEKGAKTKARTSYTASVLMTVKSWPCGREARLGSSKTDDDVSSESIVGIEKRVGSIKRGVGGRRREEAVARG